MKKTDVRANLLKVKEAINKTEQEIEDNPPVYLTKDKHISGIGYINEVSSVTELVKAHAKIQSMVKKEDSKEGLAESAAALGVPVSELKTEKKKNPLLLGLPVKYYVQDIQTRITALKQETQLAELKAAQTKLEKHLSDDDKFQDDTDGIEALLNSLQ